MTRLNFDATPNMYEVQAGELISGWHAQAGEVRRIFEECSPGIPEPAAISLQDSRGMLARWYGFATWADMMDRSTEASRQGSSVWEFEAAVEAVVNGDAEGLRKLLAANPELVRARSTRVTPGDPPVHGATLLVYLGANGVENYRQRTPANAVEIMKILLDAGAEVDATASLYGGECTTMSLLVSSCWPAQAGLQVALAETLIDYGAAINGHGSGRWTSPLMTALVFGYLDTARALVRRGAEVRTLAAAAGLGLIDDVARRLPEADAPDRHRAMALAAQLGQVEVLRLLLDAGEDPNRYNPEGFHSHGTPLHQAAVAGHLEIVRLLVERGARRDLEDTVHHGTPFGWATYGRRTEVADFLRNAS